MPGDVQILAAGTASVPVAYEVPASQEIVVRAVRGVFDGGAASGDFVPVLQFISDAGIIAVACPVCSTIAAGGSADVSWFPGVKGCCGDSDDSGAAAGITALASFNGTIGVTNPTGPTASVDLPASGVTAATYGDGTHVSQVTVDAEGRVTAAADVAIAAGGGTVANIASSGATIAVTNPAGPNVNIDLPASGVAAGSYGDASDVAQITVDAQGRITSAASVAIVGGGAVVGSDGWVDDTAETWTYASFTAGPPAVGTFTVSGDKRSKYTVGTRLKLVQTTTKYFVVSADPTFGGGNTTVTITAGTDYTLANAAISGNFHSYVVNPQGFPTWFAYAPGLTGFSGSPTVQLAEFTMVGRSCTMLFGCTGTSSATTLGASLPVPSANITQHPVGACIATDNGAAQGNPGRLVVLSNSSTLRVDKGWNVANGWTGTGTKAAQNGLVTYVV